jgi:1-acyl-sn-glycerol-3-phosphate acyltransferase
MPILFSLLYWTFVGVTAIGLYLGALVLWLLTTPFDSTHALLHRYTCWWAQLYLRCLPGCRIRLEGREKIVPGKPYVLVANHQSFTDIMALSALAVPFKWVSKKEAFRIPCIGWNMYLNDAIAVDRGNVRTVRRTLAQSRSWLERGVPLLIFPEGHRSETGEIMTFHNGAFTLAAESGCAVVPIVVNGTRHIYRGVRVCPWPGTVTVRVLDPVTLAQAGHRVGQLRVHVHEMMTQELAALRGSPQRLTA